MAGQVLPDGHIILSGSTLNKEGREAGFVCKVSPRNKVVYFYTAVTGAVCRHFDVLGNRSELLHAAFTDGKGGSSVVRLDENGKPYFLTTLPTRATASSGWSRPPTVTSIWWARARKPGARS